MGPLTIVEMQLLIAAVFFVLGLLSTILGVFILMARGYSREIKSLAAHSARIGHKGLAEDVSGLVNSASGLIEAINQLVRTASGVGSFLIFFGVLMLAATYWIITQIEMLPF